MTRIWGVQQDFFPPLHVTAFGKLTGGDNDENKANGIGGCGDVGIGRVMG
jgi:hypothetical protein